MTTWASDSSTKQRTPPFQPTFPPLSRCRSGLLGISSGSTIGLPLLIGSAVRTNTLGACHVLANLLS
jgi:hypothetical protein